jgi:regulator of sigma E protease
MDFLTPLLQIGGRLIYFAIALFGIGFLIGFHEFGHFLFCKLFGIRTPSFSIGFGPQLWSRKIGDTQFILSAIPLGGFVEIAGAAEVGQGEQEYAESTAPDSFAVKPYYQKFLVMTGGILCNLLFAYCAFIFLSFTGMPKTPLLYPTNGTTIIAQVEPDSAAAKAGFVPGDTIIAINQVRIAGNPLEAMQLVQTLPHKTVPVTIERNGVLKEVSVTIDAKKIGDHPRSPVLGSLGVMFEVTDIPGSSFFEGIKQGIRITNRWIVETVKGFISIFQRADLKGAGGPVAIIMMLTKGATSSLKLFLIILAIISINLAILNLIPLPILDGGQLLFYTIEAIIRRPLPIKIREYIHIASWLIILGLVLYLSIYDIARVAHPYIENVKQFLGFGR